MISGKDRSVFCSRITKNSFCIMYKVKIVESTSPVFKVLLRTVGEVFLQSELLLKSPAITVS